MEDIDTFVQAVLERFSTEWVQQAKERIAGRKIVVDSELLQSVASQVLPGEIRAMFAEHGRFHDMGAGNGYEKGKYMGAEERASLLKGRIPSNWYSRLSYGKVYGSGGLVDTLSNTYITKVPADLVKRFDSS